MQYEATSPQAYMELLVQDWRREKLEYIRQLIKTTAPEIEEGIEYKMLSYQLSGKSIFQLNAQKNYVSLYVGNINKVPNAAELLAGFSIGKGCIRIKKSNDLPESSIARFIEKVVEINRDGGDTDC